MKTEYPHHTTSARLVGWAVVCCLLLGAGGPIERARAQGEPQAPRAPRTIEERDTPPLGDPIEFDAALTAELDGILANQGRIAYQSFRDGNWEIYLASSDNPAARTRLTNHSASDLEPRLSPDMSRVVFISRRTGNYELFRVNADGSGLMQLTSDPATDSAATWSPDGSRIAFQSARNGNIDVYVMNADGTGVTRLTTNAEYDGEPAWSPDGAQIAFVSRRSTGELDYYLYVMNADGSGQRLLTPMPYSSRPAWSTDGKRILFDGMSVSGWQRLYHYSVDTGQLTAVGEAWADFSGNVDIMMGSWSLADEAYVTRAGYVQSNGEWLLSTMTIYLISADVGGHSPLGVIGSVDGMPSFSGPDRLPPTTTPYGTEQLLMFGRTNTTIWVHAQDNGIAGMSRIEAFASWDGGTWYRQSAACTRERELSWRCDVQLSNWPMLQGTAQSLDVQTRGFDAFGNVEALSSDPADWFRVVLYKNLVLGTVRDLRGVGLADVPVTGLPPVDTLVHTDATGAWLGHVQDPSQPYTVTAVVGAVSVSLPSTAFSSDGYRTQMADLVIPPVTNLLVNASFETPDAGWQPTAGTTLEWVARTATEPDHVRLGAAASEGDTVLIQAPLINAASAISGTTHLLAVRDQESGSALLACSAGAGCVSQPLPDARPLILAVGPGGTLGTVFQEGDLTRTFRDRNAAGQWSAGEAFPYLGGISPSLVADGSGQWHYVWVDGGVVHITSRDGAGGWSGASQLLTLPNGARAAFDATDTLHVVGCGSAGVEAVTWTEAGGMSAPVSVATTACTRYVHTLIDAAGDLYAVWDIGGGFAFARQPAGGDWGPAVVLSGTPVFGEAVAGRFGRPTVAVVSGSGSGMDFMEATSEDTWASTGLSGATRPNSTMPVAPWLLAFDAAAGRAYAVVTTSVLPPTNTNLIAYDLSATGPVFGVQQVVTIPSDMHEPTLSVRYRIHYANSGQAVTMRIQGIDEAEPTVVDLMTGNWHWATRWVDVSAWAGETVTVTVSLDVNGSPYSLPVDVDWMYLGAWTTPSVTGLTPARLEAGSGTVTITGDNFIGAPTVRIADQTLPTTVIDAQHLSVTIPSGLAPGRHTVVVANPDGSAAIAPVSLTVRHALDLPVLLRWGH